MEKNTLIIKTIQPDLIWENKKANFDRLWNLADNPEEKKDLIVFPEMFTTGFSMQSDKYAENESGETFKWMKHLAIRNNCAVAGSFITREGEKIFNRLLFVDETGVLVSYDKHHLFGFEGESEHYSPGNERKVFSYRGWRILPQICYDLRFPVWSRNRNDYDLIINVANWPESRRDVWITLLKARAIENQSYVIGVNRIGNDGNKISYSGDTLIYNPKGITLYNSPLHKEAADITILDMDELIGFRNKFPVWKDADNFTLMNS
jgi:omega-amidase